MTSKDKLLELKVGIFVALGLVVIAVMAFRFGKMGEQARDTYPLVLELPNANGILRNSEVQLAGARVGFVASKPRITENVSAVRLELQILTSVKIPRSAYFQVGSSGLLGDRFIEITRGPEFDPDKFDPSDPSQTWNPGDYVVGRQAGGFEALTRKGEEVLDQLNEGIQKLKETTDNINQRLLSPQNVKNLEDTIANLKTTSANFTELSKNANAVVLNANTTVESANKTMETANKAASDLRDVMGDARKVLDEAQDFLRRASHGGGLLNTLMTDRKLADDMRALVSNLRTRGILFYRDTAPRLRETPAPQRQPQRQQRRRR